MSSAFPLDFVLVDGHLTAFHVEGPPNAPLVLLLHGLGAAGSSYAEVARRLSGTYRVLVPDLLGSGRTAKPLMAYSPQEMAAHLAGLLAQLRLGPVACVVGHSQGGAVAAELCHQLQAAGTPSGNLVLIDPPPTSGMRWLRPVARLPVAPRLAELVSSLLPHRRLARAWLGFLYADPSRLTEEVLAGYVGTSSGRGYAAATARAIHSLARLDLHLETAPPTLLIWGAEDKLFPPSLAAAWQARLPSSRLVVLPATGHCPHEEQPAAVAVALREFLAPATSLNRSV